MKGETKHVAQNVIAMVLFSLKSFRQPDKKRKKGTEKQAREDLKKALTDLDAHNHISLNTPLVKEEGAAVQIAEAILFDVYGTEKIEAQRPYEIHHLDHFWVLKGSQPEGGQDSSFLIILDDRDCEVVRLTHE
jgi:hypothetical protein